MMDFTEAVRVRAGGTEPKTSVPLEQVGIAELESVQAKVAELEAVELGLSREQSDKEKKIGVEHVYMKV
jgi:hypothetical protein